MLASPKTILIIDDEPNLLMGVRVLLERAGYHTLTATDGMAGLRAAREASPDLIVCDVMMPILDGFAVRERLAGDSQTSEIPFLFLTARIGQADKLRGLQTGADDYITKPFDHRELLARISAVLKRYDRGQEIVRREVDRQISCFQQEISHNISHELRTPMTQILLSLEMVLRDRYDDPAELKQFIEIALSQSQHLNSLIDDLVFLSNADRGAVNTLRQKVDVEMDFLMPIRACQERYAEKNLRLHLDVGSGLSIHAPRREFKQAALHLVENAFKFAPPLTGVWIDLQRNGEGGCTLLVADYGMGIPFDLREKVFDRYFQVSQGDTRAYNGLGVGLTIARIVARGLGGDVVVLPSSQGCRVSMTVSPGAADLA
ncbi:MAG: hybrid sensor histidine kinase/response regulator [Chloroflexi bacterium]|nr:hybrid sensor histidine kinase/response regulator [Chloroflexota bacterium]